MKTALMSRRAQLGALAIAVVLATPALAKAQACCAGALGSAGLRLRMFDRAAVQVDFASDRQLGLWNDAGAFTESRARVIDLRQLVSGALRLPFLPRAELSVQVPFQQGYRATSRASEWGSGLADLSLAARYTILEVGEHGWPGLGVVVGGLVPTGRASSDSTGTLGADITGAGTYRYGAEFWVEKSKGPLYLAAVPGIANTPQTAKLGGGDEVELSGRAIAGWTFTHGAVVAGNVQMIYDQARNTSFGAVPSKYRPSVGLGISIPVGEAWFVQAFGGTDVPVAAIGRNETSLLRGQIGLRYAFLAEE